MKPHHDDHHDDRRRLVSNLPDDGVNGVPIFDAQLLERHSALAAKAGKPEAVEQE